MLLLKIIKLSKDGWNITYIEIFEMFKASKYGNVSYVIVI